jgi:hypothetical protein
MQFMSDGNGRVVEGNGHGSVAEALGFTDTPSRADTQPMPPGNADEHTPGRTFTVAGKFYTDFAAAIRAQYVRLRNFLRACGITDAELAQVPEPDVPTGATPETFNPQPRWPVSEALDQFFENRFKLLSAAELDSPAHETRYLIPGILAAGQTGGIFGPSKTLKTSIAADLLISLASGTPFLGKFLVAQPGKVLFLAGQTGLSALRAIVRRICDARGLSLDSLSNFLVSTDLPKLDHAVDRMAFQELLQREKPVCVVIDPAFLAMQGLRGGSNSLVSMGQMLAPLSEMCRETGCAVLIVHHCRRTMKVGVPATLDDIAGTGFGELSHQWLLLSRRRPFNPASGRHELWLGTGNRLGESALWELDVDEGVDSWKARLRPVASSEMATDEQYVAASEDRQLRRRGLAFERQCRRAQELLAAHPAGLTARRMREMLGVSGERINRVLEWLVQQGIVNKEPANRERGRTIWTYFLVSSAADFSLSAIKEGSLTPRDAKIYDTGTGQFVDASRGNAPAPGAASAEQADVLSPAGRDISAEPGRDTSAGPPTHTDEEAQEPSPRPSPSGLGEGECMGRDTNIDGKNEQNSTPASDVASSPAPSPPTPLPRGERGEDLQLPEADGGATAMS